jgi:para-aminobenzoate synthetase component I
MADAAQVKQKMLNWAQQFNIFCFLDSQQYQVAPHRYDCLLAVGATSFLQGDAAAFKNAGAFFNKKRWLFGHLSFELQHASFKIETSKRDATGFPPFYFFEPQALLFIKENVLHIEAEDPQSVYDAVMAWGFEKVAHATVLNLQQQLSKAEYLRRVQQLQQHILRGDCYEINFCTAFFAPDVVIDPIAVFQNLMLLSPNPFSALYKLNDKYLICASPERFLVRQGNSLLAQPIKGTAKRSAVVAEDIFLKETLRNSAKEQAENVMVVDLMRNDLSKICLPGSVHVDELFGVYSFPQVHQLISTISGTLKRDTRFTNIIEATFPMGSMTGAPKQRVLQLIEQYEPTARGLFSGSVGYITPDGDFDLNVVIRSLMYNETTQYLSYQVGSGITFYSNAEQEWEECLLKASAIKKVLTG